MELRTLLYMPVFLCLALAWGTATAAGLSRNIQVPVDGLTRSYDLYVPARAAPSPRPLVILLHGHSGDADVMTGANGKKAPYKR